MKTHCEHQKNAVTTFPRPRVEQRLFTEQHLHVPFFSFFPFFKITPFKGAASCPGCQPRVWLSNYADVPKLRCAPSAFE